MSETRPDDIRIADLAAPELTDLQKLAKEGVAQIPIDLGMEALLDQGRQETGLSSFGDEEFLDRMAVWLQAVGEDAELGAIGRVGVHRDILRYTKNRLRFEDLIARHPEILDERIEQPIIIAGLPRSGTTHLLNLIAADTRLRSLRYWESVEPIPIPGEAPGEDGVDPRLARCRENYAQQDMIMPLLKNMHDMAPEHVHEEIELQCIDFSSYELEWIATVPRWRDYYLAHDQRPSYDYMKNVLKALQWLRGPKRWILKSPQHMEQLGPLMDTFPDATVAITHRDPVSVIASAVTMLCYGDRMRRTRVDPPAVAAYWIDRVEKLLRACVRDRELVPAERSIDVLFHEFMADDLATVNRIYELAGLEMNEGARAELQTYMDENPRGKHGRIVYDLKGDFGVERDALRERFAFYFDRFAVKVEQS
jgi:hypothetical protein